MIDRLAVDANAVIELIRNDRVAPAPLVEAGSVFLPLPVAGELFGGVSASRRRKPSDARRVARALDFARRRSGNRRVYGRISARLRSMPSIRQSRINDLWIAALCIQHSLPLLSNDRGFDALPELTVIHW
jgi:tRNA(fMet)-specific endonuclease VapC